MIYPLVRDLAAEDFPVRLTCGVLGFSTQGYYRWLANPISDRDLADAYLTNALVDAHGHDPAFGYRFLADELERDGIRVHFRVSPRHGRARSETGIRDRSGALSLVWPRGYVVT